MGYVYILQSLKDEKYYIGSTLDLERRIAEHNSGNGGIYTSMHAPWKLVWQKKCTSISEARVEEKKIKSYKGGNGFKNLLRRGG